MQAQIQKWGNSLGVRIPKSIACALNLNNGTFVNLELSNNNLIINNQVSELDLLLNNITDDNCHHEIFSDDEIVSSESW